MDARSFLMGSGSPGFSFAIPGTRLVGQILTEPRMQQQRVFGKNELAFWPSGDPKLQLAVDVQTTFRNYEGIAKPDPTRPDTGARTVYIKGKHFEKAAKDAILVAGASFLEVGGWLDVTYIGEDMSSSAGSKPKMFAVTYTPPPPGFQAQQAPQMPTQQQFASQPSVYTPQGHGYPQQQPQPSVYGQQYGQPAPMMTYGQAPVGYGAPVAQPQMPQPPHHENGPIPAWAAAPVSAAPVSPSQMPVAPVSPAPAPMSTLDAIRAARQVPNSAPPVEEAPF